MHKTSKLQRPLSTIVYIHYHQYGYIKGTPLQTSINEHAPLSEIFGLAPALKIPSYATGDMSELQGCFEYLPIETTSGVPNGGMGGPDPITLQKYDPQDLSTNAKKFSNKGVPPHFLEFEGRGRKCFPRYPPDTPISRVLDTPLISTVNFSSSCRMNLSKLPFERENNNALSQELRQLLADKN